MRRIRFWLFKRLIGPVIAICPEPQQSLIRHMLSIGVTGFVAEIAEQKDLPPEFAKVLYDGIADGSLYVHSNK